MVIMASGIVRGRVRTTTTATESLNKETNRDIKPWFMVYFFEIGQACYDQLTPVKIGNSLTSIMWPYRGLKFTAYRDHMFFGSLPLTNCWFSDWITGSCRVHLLK